MSRQLYLATVLRFKLSQQLPQLKWENGGNTPLWAIKRRLFLMRVIRKEEAKLLG